MDAISSVCFNLRSEQDAESQSGWDVAAVSDGDEGRERTLISCGLDHEVPGTKLTVATSGTVIKIGAENEV